MSSGFGRDGFRPDHGHHFGPGRTSFCVQPWECIASCAGGPADLLAPSRRPPNIPVAARVPSSGSVEAWAQPSWAKAEHRRSEGSSPSGADHRATPLYSVGPRGPDHDAVMRISGEAPGRRAHSRKRCRHHAMLRVTATSDRQRRPVRSCSPGSEGLSAFSFHAARKTTPAGTSPVVTMRHSAISSFLASATIRVLRVLPRASAVRARYHCESALSF